MLLPVATCPASGLGREGGREPATHSAESVPAWAGVVVVVVVDEDKNCQ